MASAPSTDREEPQATVSVAIVVPCFNVAPWLDKCLESIRSQTYRNLEIICVDDGSSDGSADIVTRHQAQDRRVRLHRQANQGPGVARNAGMDLATAGASYLTFVDGDDWIDPRMVETLVRRALDLGVDVVCCGGYIYNHEARECGLWQPPETLYAPSRFRVVDHPYVLSSTSPWAKLFDLSFLRTKAIRFPEDLYFEDIPFVYQALLEADSVSVVNERLYFYRQQRPGPAISTYKGSRHVEAFEMLSRIESFLSEKNLVDSIGPVFARYKTSHLLMSLRAVWLSREIEPSVRWRFLELMAAALGSMKSGDFDCATARHVRVDRWLLGCARRGQLRRLRLLLRALPALLPSRIRSRTLGLPY